MKQRDAPNICPSEDILERQEVSNLAAFEIMYDDLTLKAQIRLCETFNTHPVIENWETQPLAVVCRENE